MEISFRNMHHAISQKLIERTEKRIQRLGHLIDEGKFEALAFVEINKATGAHRTGNVWRASINLDARGDRFHAEAINDTPEKAADRMVRELQSELRTHRMRERSIKRKEGGLWKSLQQQFS
jgi:ribosome-associated translation inhibitor RaiA